MLAHTACASGHHPPPLPKGAETDFQAHGEVHQEVPMEGGWPSKTLLCHEACLLISAAYC